METTGPEIQLRIEGGGTLRVSLGDGTVIGIEEVPPSAALSTCSALNAVGESFEKVENHRAAARVYEAGARISQVSGNRFIRAQMLNNQGLALKRDGDLKAALTLYESAAALLKEPEQSVQGEMQRTQLLAVTLLNSATLHLSQGEPEKAEQCARWGLELVEYREDEVARSVAQQCRNLLANLGV